MGFRYSTTQLWVRVNKSIYTFHFSQYSAFIVIDPDICVSIKITRKCKTIVFIAV